MWWSALGELPVFQGWEGSSQGRRENHEWYLQTLADPECVVWEKGSLSVMTFLFPKSLGCCVQGSGTGGELNLPFSHLQSGWGVFGLACMLSCWIHQRVLLWDTDKSYHQCVHLLALDREPWDQQEMCPNLCISTHQGGEESESRLIQPTFENVL